MVEAVKHYEVYLHGKEFVVQTDHKALQSLMSSNHLNRRLWRWALFLQDFSVNFVYRPGAQNIVADPLS